MPGRALIVEDETEIRDLLAYAVSREGCAFDTASDGAEAIARLESNTYELILLDLMMPHVDGHAVLRFLSRMPAQRPIVIVMSARVSLSEDETNVVTAVAKKPAGIVVILEILPDLCRTLKESPMSPATPGDQREDIRRE